MLLAGSLQASQAQDVRLENNAVLVTGPLQVRLAFTDQNNVVQDIPLQNLPPAAFNSLPVPLQQAKSSALLQGAASSFFDQLWSSNRGNVCGDIFAEITADINSSDNTAYNINCTTNERGALTATIQTSWQDEYGFTVTGRRLVLDYWIPYNDAVFTVTSPCTCSQSNAVCAADPQFTVVFDVHLLVKFQSNDPASIALPFTDAHFGSVDFDLIVTGDYGDAVHNATTQWGIDLAAGAAASLATGEPILGLADLIASTGQLLVQFGGIGVAAACNNHLGDDISARLSILSSGTAGSDAVSIGQQFGSLFQDLLAGYTAGFNHFDIVGDSKGDLIFRWTSPPGTKPQLFNVDAGNNGPPSLFPPMIGAEQTQVPAGGKLTVHGNYFAGAYTTHLRIGWNDTTPPGKPVKGEVDWRPVGGAIQHATTTQSMFEANGLQPGAKYQFRVGDCTPIACTPSSDWFSTATQTQGSDQVVLSLDSSATTIGNAILGGDGSFTTSVTIPQGTAPGQHTMYATVGAQGNSFPTGGGKFVRLEKPPLNAVSAHLFSARAPVTAPANAIARLPSPWLTTSPIIGKIVVVNPGGGQQAKLPIVVCGAGGCNPSIAEINPYTNTPYAAGGGIYVATERFTLEGEHFAPNGGVILYLDTPSGRVIGATNVGGSGTFQANFTMPNVTGKHTLVAVETSGGHAFQAKLAIVVDELPQ
jgi:hypothetical protein